MKRLICFILTIALCVGFLSACDAPIIKNKRITPDDPDTPVAAKDEIRLLDTCDGSVKSVYAVSPDGVTENTHSVSPVSSYDGEKYVGLFYFLWNGMNGREQTGIYDATKLMQERGVAGFFDWSQTATEEREQYHYWGEPLFGYYSADDPFVLKRHLEMLTFAGIDFLAFDVTNESVYTATWSSLFPIMQEFYDQGFNVPKFVFYTRDSGVSQAATSANKIENLYTSFYRDGDYYDLWFQPNGKPVIIGEKDDCPQEIQNFFDFRAPQWPNEGAKDDGVPWIDFTYPQPVYARGGAKGGSIMSVSVAQHPELVMSDGVYSSSYYNSNRGRGYNGSNNDKSRINDGINFQRQWNTVLSQQPSTVFVTGWNEWLAKKMYGVPFGTSGGAERVYMIDSCNEEFSRDIEPMKGGYGDYYYLQLVHNIRAYKGVGAGITANGQRLSIDIFGDIKQWDAVTDSFRDFTGDAVKRNYRNAANTDTIVDNSARNDISEIRLCFDDEYIYVLVSTFANITEREDDDLTFMNLLLGVQGSTDGNFAGFNYIVNRTLENGKASVEKSTGGYNFVKTGDADYSVDKKYMQLKIPKSALGISSDFTLTVKVTDHLTNPADIMDYYVSGDSAPIGRFGYVWSV